MRKFLGNRIILSPESLTLAVLNIPRRYSAKNSLRSAFAHSLGLGAGYDGIFLGATIPLVNNHILGYIHQTTGKIAGIGRTQGCVRQALSGAVRRNKVFKRRETLFK